jgi:hypothetical protein
MQNPDLNLTGNLHCHSYWLTFASKLITSGTLRGAILRGAALKGAGTEVS